MPNPPRPRVRIVSGSGRYTDPWHPFAETSAAIAALVEELGLQADVVDAEPDAFDDLDRTDLVVINAGGNPQVDLDPDPTWTAAFDRFAAWLGDGHPVLGVHTASNAFPDWPAWPTLLGGQWIRGRSMHPPRSDFTFDVAPGAEGHPALGGLTSVTVHDERYSRLEVHEGSIPLLQQRFDDVDHVMAWARPTGVRAVYDGLGHGPESYASAERRQLLAAEIGWLLDRPAT